MFKALAAALATPEIEEKLALTAALAADWQAGKLDSQDPTPVALVCGRPPRPELVPPRQVLQRGVQSIEGRARMLHAIVHIEFSAINLALDHAARFRGMPPQYYADWIVVAAEEARHFAILRQRLQALGHDYGDFPAHAGLWDMAEKTTGDVLARMALVPRLLDIILADEIGHVGLGDAWFRHLCSERQLEPEATFRHLLDTFDAPWPQAPFNEAARLQAGFSRGELAALAKKV